MSVVLRCILIIASVGTCIFISRKLKKSQVNRYEMSFWIVLSGLLILISIFPGIIDLLCRILGIYSPVNTVFLIIIFSLLIRTFLLHIKLSRLEHQVMELAQELAIEKKIHNEKRNEKEL